MDSETAKRHHDAPRESKRPTKTEIRSALAARDITGKGADLLVKKFDEAYRKVEANGGINAVRASVLDRIEAARAGLTEGVRQ